MTALDEAAFADLYRDEYPRLVAFVAARAGRDVAEDLAQDCFFKAWRSRDQYRPDAGSAAQWLFGIAKNLIVDHHRATGRRPSTVDDSTLALELAADLVDVAEQVTTAAEATEVLAHLPERQREMVARRYALGQPVAEVAAAMGVPAGTVKSGCARALAALRTALDVVAPAKPRPADPTPVHSPTPEPEETPVAPVSRPASRRPRPHRCGVGAVPPGDAPHRPPVSAARRRPGPRHRLVDCRHPHRPGPPARRRPAAATDPPRLGRPAGAGLAACPTRPPRTQGDDFVMFPVPAWLFWLGCLFLFVAPLALAYAFFGRWGGRPVLPSRFVDRAHAEIARILVAGGLVRVDEPALGTDILDGATEPLPTARHRAPEDVEPEEETKTESAAFAPRFTGFLPADPDLPDEEPVEPQPVEESTPVPATARVWPTPTIIVFPVKPAEPVLFRPDRYPVLAHGVLDSDITEAFAPLAQHYADAGPGARS